MFKVHQVKVHTNVIIIIIIIIIVISTSNMVQ